jgi:hypothetical protein
MTKVNCKDCSQSDCVYLGIDYEHPCKDFVLKAAPSSPVQPAAGQEPVAQSLKDAVFTVLEGFTLPHDVRKILETAYYATPPTAPVQEPVYSIEKLDKAYELGFSEGMKTTPPASQRKAGQYENL